MKAALLELAGGLPLCEILGAAHLGQLGAGQQGALGIAAGGLGEAEAAAEHLQDGDQHDGQNREGDQHLQQGEASCPPRAGVGAQASDLRRRRR